MKNQATFVGFAFSWLANGGLAASRKMERPCLYLLIAVVINHDH
jgi:hypothetical protein